MAIHVEILQIRCLQLTHPRGNDDEIYVAYAVGVAAAGASGTSSDGKTAIAGGRVSSVKENVRKGSHWEPDKGLDGTFDVGPALAVILNVALFEKDDGDFRKQLIKKIDKILEPPKFDWTQIKPPGDVTSWTAWLKCVWKALGAVFRRVMEDDHLGSHEIAITLDKAAQPNDDWTGTRELRFKRFGGDYRVMIRLTEK